MGILSKKYSSTLVFQFGIVLGKVRLVIAHLKKKHNHKNIYFRETKTIQKKSK